MKLDNEQELLQQIAGGNHEAFGKLVRALGPYLYSQVFRISHNRQLSEEVVQDVFVQIWHTREVLATINNVYGYLFTISKNRTLDVLRKHAAERRNRRKWESAQDAAAVEPAPENDTVLNLLDQAINALPPQQHKVWVMSRRLRMKYEEIATELGISKDAVNKYLQASNRNIIKWIREKEGLYFFLLCILKKIF